MSEYNTNAIFTIFKGYEFLFIKELDFNRFCTSEVYSLYGRHNGYADWLLLDRHGVGNQTLEEYFGSCYINNMVLRLKEKYKED